EARPSCAFCRGVLAFHTSQTDGPSSAESSRPSSPSSRRPSMITPLEPMCESTSAMLHSEGYARCSRPASSGGRRRPLGPPKGCRWIRPAAMSERTLRWGLLSTARINAALLPALRECERAEPFAVASRDGARAEAYRAEQGLARAHGSYEALLADPD